MKEELIVKSVAVTASGFSGWLAFVVVDLPIAIFGVPFTFLFASFAGASIALALLPPMMRWKAFFAVIVGTVTGAWLVQPLTELVGFKAPYPGVAFLLGLLGHTVIGWLVKRVPLILERALERRLGGVK